MILATLLLLAGGFCGTVPNTAGSCTDTTLHLLGGKTATVHVRASNGAVRVWED
jgi:hypothetical protein